MASSHLSERWRSCADAVEASGAKNPGFFQNRIHTGVRLRLDCAGACLPLVVAERLRAHFGDSVDIVENAVRPQATNMSAAVARLETLLQLFAEGRAAKMALAVEANRTLGWLADGAYPTRDGRTVSLRDTQDAAIAATRIYLPDELASLPARSTPLTTTPTRIEVSGETTAQAGRRLVEKEGVASVVALNFASAVSVGGGFLRGSKAQEEDLCRCSALYRCLAPQHAYYDVNRALASHFYTDAMIYSPSVPFFRDESLQPLDAPFLLSILTVPAPFAAQLPADEHPRLPSVIATRIERMLDLLAHLGHRTLILGAWGCGAFRNDPEVVSSAFAAALNAPERRGSFDRIVFAVYDPSGTNRAPFDARFGAASGFVSP